MEIVFLSAAAAWATIGAVWDVKCRRVPNVVSYSGLLAGILLRSSLLGWRGLTSAVAGGLVGGGMFFLLYLVKAMGAGDVKLMAAVGSLAGTPAVFHIMLACALAGGIMALFVTLYRSTATRTFRNVWELLRFHAAHGPQVHPTLNLDNPQTTRLPYALAIAAGTGYALLETLLAR